MYTNLRGCGGKLLRGDDAHDDEDDDDDDDAHDHERDAQMCDTYAYTHTRIFEISLDYTVETVRISQ